MKTQMSRFQIHDDLTAPEASLPVVKGALAGAGQLPNFLGVLAGSPAALRAYARFRSELRNNGTLPLRTLERIALAVAALHRSDAGLTLHAPTGRRAGRGATAPPRGGPDPARPDGPPGGPRPRRAPPGGGGGLARRARGGAAALSAPARRAPPVPEPPARGGARGGVDGRAAARGGR